MKEQGLLLSMIRSCCWALCGLAFMAQAGVVCSHDYAVGLDIAPRGDATGRPPIHSSITLHTLYGACDKTDGYRVIGCLPELKPFFVNEGQCGDASNRLFVASSCRLTWSYVSPELSEKVKSLSCFVVPRVWRVGVGAMRHQDGGMDERIDVRPFQHELGNGRLELFQASLDNGVGRGLEQELSESLKSGDLIFHSGVELFGRVDRLPSGKSIFRHDRFEDARRYGMSYSLSMRIDGRGVRTVLVFDYVVVSLGSLGKMETVGQGRRGWNLHRKDGSTPAILLEPVEELGSTIGKSPEIVLMGDMDLFQLQFAIDGFGTELQFGGWAFSKLPHIVL